MGRIGPGLGSLALASLLNGGLHAADARARTWTRSARSARLHFAPKAKRVIYLFMSGAPSHIDLFDAKPKLNELTGEELPDSVRMGQRITGMTSGQAKLLLVGPAYPFKTLRPVRHRDYRADAAHRQRSPTTSAIVRSLHTDPINHDPAVTYLLTGNQQPGRPTIGSWAAYGLGSENKNLPEYVVLLSGGGGQPLLSRYWGNGFLPSRYQGVQFRSTGDPVLYVSNPDGIDPATRRQLLDGVQELNRMHLEAVGDPEIATRIDAYEMAYRMQTSVPELMDISQEPQQRARHVRGRAGQVRRSPTTACWPGGWPSATCASCSSITAIGTITATCPTS